MTDKVQKIREEDQKIARSINPYIPDEETVVIRNCLVCKNCLPPFFRENGNMCKLEECNFEEA